MKTTLVIMLVVVGIMCFKFNDLQGQINSLKAERNAYTMSIGD